MPRDKDLGAGRHAGPTIMRHRPDSRWPSGVALGLPKIRLDNVRDQRLETDPGSPAEPGHLLTKGRR